MDNFSANVRFLLWENSIERRLWPEKVAAWADCDIRRAEEILRGDAPRRGETTRIAKITGIPMHDLVNKDLLAGSDVDVLRENLRHLANGMERGRKRTFASEIGVHPTTISAWLSGKQRPERTNLVEVCRYYHLPTGTDLEKDPLFLSVLPVAETQRKRWLRERIDELDPAALQGLFPALAKLLGTR